MEVKIEKRGSVEGLAVFLPFEERPFPLSKSTKSFTVASTHGVKKTGVIVDGEALNVGVNSYITNRDYVKHPK